MRKIIRRVSLYPPYLGAGIKLKNVNKDFTRFEVQMKMHWYNRNIFGTHFGGSLYAMSDPFFVFIIMNFLGKEYIVWDKSANIKFVKPGKGTVNVVFEISKDKLEELKNDVDEKGKNTYFFKTEITNSDNEVVARIEKEIYVKKKN
ncbi:MAG: tetrameric acyl-CoA thioesterase [Bacteroidetes bacterium]|nr:MAG: tetrameric acyl-CoA thioesterase [Bacteroidota bacterium]